MQESLIIFGMMLNCYRKPFVTFLCIALWPSRPCIFGRLNGINTLTSAEIHFPPMRLRLFLLFASLSLLPGCASQTNTNITSEWKDPQTGSYKDFFVAVLVKNLDARRTLESDIYTRLKRNGAKARPSLEVFPHTERPGTPEERDAAVEKIKGLGHDAIITVILLKKEEEKIYTPGKAEYAPTTVGYGTGYNNRTNMNNVSTGTYGAFGAYYIDNYQMASTDGHYESLKVYSVQSNLYDAATGKLVLSIKSDTFDTGNLAAASGDLAEAFVNLLRKNKLISYKGKG